MTEFKNATDCCDIYVMMRVFKKCYDFSQKNSILLMPIKEPSFTLEGTSINNTVVENDKIWSSIRLDIKNSEMLEYCTSGFEFFNKVNL